MAKKKKYNAVKINVELNIMASDEMVERLNNGEGVQIALNNCFKRNNRGVVSIEHKVMATSESWDEIKDVVFDYEETNNYKRRS